MPLFSISSLGATLDDLSFFQHYRVVASRTVSRLWEITIVVRPSISRPSGSITVSLDFASRPVVGSSSTSIGASLIIARAIATRCLCPSESSLPFCLLASHSLLGNASMNLWASAALAAAMISFSLALACRRRCSL